MADEEVFTGRGFPHQHASKRWDGFTITGAELREKAIKSPYAALCVQLLEDAQSARRAMMTAEKKVEDMVEVADRNSATHSRENQAKEGLLGAVRSVKALVKCLSQDLCDVDPIRYRDEEPPERSDVVLGRIMQLLDSAESAESYRHRDHYVGPNQERDLHSMESNRFFRQPGT